MSQTHDITGLPLDAEGWTDWLALFATAAYAGARILYVSDTDGNDSTAEFYAREAEEITDNGGNILAPGGSILPYKTLAAAFADTRTGEPDIILAKRGDTFAVTFNPGSKSGAGASALAVVGCYGSMAAARPTLSGFTHSGQKPSFRAAFGLRTTASLGTEIWTHGINCLWEDILAVNGADFVTTGNDDADIWFRRCMTNGGRWFMENVDGFLIEECGIDGDAATVPSKHNCYLNFSAINGVSRRNISARALAVGFRQRGGGVVHNNLVMDAQKDSSWQSGIYTIEVGNGESTQLFADTNTGHNVILHSRLGYGFKNIKGADDPASIHHNIAAHQTIGASGAALSVHHKNSWGEYGNIDIDGVAIIAWPGGTGINLGSSNRVANVSVANCDIQQTGGGNVIASGGTSDFTASNNRYHSTSSNPYNAGSGAVNFADWVTATGDTDSAEGAVSYPDSGRNIVTYMESIGGGPYEGTAQENIDTAIADFMAGALANTRGDWSDDYVAWQVNNYIFAGLGWETLEHPYGGGGDPPVPPRYAVTLGGLQIGART